MFNIYSQRQHQAAEVQQRRKLHLERITSLKKTRLSDAARNRIKHKA